MSDVTEDGQSTTKFSSPNNNRTRGLAQRLRDISDNQTVKELGELAAEQVVKSVQNEDSVSRVEIPPSVESLNTRRVASAANTNVDGLLPAGVQLQNRYKLLGVIGIGGMGAVYKAQDLRFPGVMRLCAVKEMINTATDPQVRQMIVRNLEFFLNPTGI